MTAREKMIQHIQDYYGLDSPQVFSAMRAVPREKFLPSRFLGPYSDCAIPIGHKQTMSQPYTVAFMTHLLDLKGLEKVLEIGTGSGYQAAILSHLAREVYTIERIDKLAQKAKRTLNKLGFKNVHVKSGQGEKGWPQKAPFDAILITARVTGKLPQALISQLKDGGVIVAPIGETMTRFTKKGDELKKETFGSFRFVPFVED